MGFEHRSQIRPSTGYADPKESIQLGFGRGEDMSKCWPSNMDCPDFKKDAETFMKEVQGLSVQVMELMAEAVGLVSMLASSPVSWAQQVTLKVAANGDIHKWHGLA